MRTELWQIIKDLSGTENVWWANGNQEFTGRPLITMRLGSIASNNADYAPTDSEGVAIVSQDQLVTLSLQYYDDSSPFAAFDALQAIRNKFELITTQQTLRASGFSYVQVLQDVTDAPALAGTKWESRAVLDIQLRALMQQSDTIGFIESVEIDGTINGNINVGITPEG
jgi:hypothetical protein